MKYCPFLKLKQNEVMALRDLEDSVLSTITPFFDIARPQNISKDHILKSIETGLKHLTRHLNDKEFYIDTYDIPDSIMVENKHIYEYILNKFSDLPFIPVTGLNRTPKHLASIRNFYKDKALSRIALRLTDDDFEDFDLVEDEITKFADEFYDAETDFILDFRLIKDENTFEERVENAKSFLHSLENTVEYNRIIVTGSSICPNISEHAETKIQTTLVRYEWDVFLKLCESSQNGIIYGDYSIISPDYSDANIPVNLLQNVSTPKVFYTEKDIFHIFRGAAFKTDPRGRDQYFDIAKLLVKKSFYRKKEYSEGDNFIYQKSQEKGSPSGQGHWYRMLNNCHISYICKDLL